VTLFPNNNSSTEAETDAAFPRKFKKGTINARLVLDKSQNDGRSVNEYFLILKMAVLASDDA